MGGWVKDEMDLNYVFRPTVKNFWRFQGAVAWIYQKMVLEQKKNQRRQEQPDGDEDQDDDEAEEEAQHKVAEDCEKEARVKSKQELEALPFARSKSGDDGHGRYEDPSSAHHWHFSEKDEEELNIQQLRIEIESLPVDGEETWLDCLISSVEREWTDGESVVTEVLRTSDMQARSQRRDRSLNEFYVNAHQVLLSLENKANKRYYDSLEKESNHRMKQLNKQNEVLHDYVCQLEDEFSKIMEKIHEYKGKKEEMLAKLGGLIDDEAYGHLEGQLRLLHAHDKHDG